MTTTNPEQEEKKNLTCHFVYEILYMISSLFDNILINSYILYL